jgi:hypothetical protein
MLTLLSDSKDFAIIIIGIEKIPRKIRAFLKSLDQPALYPADTLSPPVLFALMNARALGASTVT